MRVSTDHSPCQYLTFSLRHSVSLFERSYANGHRHESEAVLWWRVAANQQYRIPQTVSQVAKEAGQSCLVEMQGKVHQLD